MRPQAGGITKLLAWIGAALAAIGGVFVADTLQPVIFIVAIVAAIGLIIQDVLIDKMPNQVAALMLVLIPSLAGSISGKLHRWIEGFTDWIKIQVGKHPGDLVGTMTPFAIGLVAIIAGVALSWRAMPKRGGH